MKRRSALPYGPYGLGRTLRLRLRSLLHRNLCRRLQYDFIISHILLRRFHTDVVDMSMISCICSIERRVAAYIFISEK